MSWQKTYLNYDDDALAVFASAGLLRRARKDVDNQKVALSDNEQGIFNSDGQTVTLAAQGILQATCDCSAAGCCKHILAAVLWLQTEYNETSEAVKSELDERDDTQPLLPEILAMDAQGLIKLIPKADCRLAVKILQDWQTHCLLQEDLGTQLKIFIPNHDEPIIYIKGNGFAGMLSSLPEKQRKALHLAVIAKLFAENHQDWQWPEDLVPAAATRNKLSDDDKSVILTIQRFIDDMLRQGLSHISKSSAAQLHLLNMSARAEGLPRLANYLKRLSQQVKLLAERHFTVDEGQVLRFIAQIYAYSYQLQHANETELMVLRGLIRRQYAESVNILNLVPIDAHWWKTQSHAVGLTLSFWDSETKQIIQCTQGRANQLDPTFNRINVWQTQAIWKQTANNLMRKTFALHQPRVSEEGKLAAAGESFAQDANAFTITDYLQLQTDCGYTDWQAAADYLANLTEDAFFEPMVLHIADYQQIHWNETEQCIIWPVMDKNQQTAFLRLNWEGHEETKIEELRALTKEKVAIRAVTVQIIYDQQQIQLIPKTLWLEKKQQIEWFYLDFDSRPRMKQRSKFVNTILEYMARKQKQNLDFAPMPSFAGQLVRPIVSILETQACTGRQQLSLAQQDVLRGTVRTLDDLGMLWLSHQVKTYVQHQKTDAEQRLRLIYLCDQFEQLQMPLPFQLNA